ncbi:hypothetical protein, partial [Bifidobacterium sp.]|uniref:hypothetical protein n=1 Tax=Bifidobacterium sp. TaxID=41200 RepID=UPI002A915C85
LQPLGLTGIINTTFSSYRPGWSGGARTETPGLRGERIVPVPGAGDGRLLSVSTDGVLVVGIGRRPVFCLCRR